MGKFWGQMQLIRVTSAPYLELSISRQPHFLFQQQNNTYPSSRHMIIIATSRNVLESIITSSMPTAIQNNANPMTLFIFHTQIHFLLYSMHFFLTYSCSFSPFSRISTTSSSVIFLSFPEENLSITSGTISRIFVMVS